MYKFEKKLLIIIIIMTFISFFRNIKNQMYYKPNKSHFLFKPDKQIKDIWIPYDENNKIHAWYYYVKNKPLILFCHGNAGNISHRHTLIKNMVYYNISFFIFDYKGFGKSDGTTFIESIYNDTELCYNYIHNKLNIKNIIAFGESIGAFPASKLAKKYNLKKLILFTGINSIFMVIENFKYLKYLKWLSYGDLNVGKQLIDYNGDVLIMHSNDDEIVNIKNAKKNCEILGKGKCQFEIIEGTHNYPKFDWNILNKFIDN
jgi:hypothetical protein